MGAGVSNYRLANTVSKTGQLGVVSSVALDTILARRLQDGDPDGAMRRGLAKFPFPEIAARILDKYFIDGGRPAEKPYKLVPMLARVNPREASELLVAANFVEVTLAKEGHSNPVGINLLEKIQLFVLPSLYGAMLAGVDYVLIGAGIPLKIPGVLDAFAKGEPATYPLNVAGAQADDDTLMRFDPRDFFGDAVQPLPRPGFLAIISSNTLATTMLRRANGKVDGFIIEGPTAGGHNAPPRGQMVYNERGECVYGERDRVDMEKIRQMGVPFWLAGGYGTPEKVVEALELGAAGVQVGTAFCYSEESGLRDDYKAALIAKIQRGEASVFTDPRSSPTGFPFKAAQLEGTSSEAEVYAARKRICDVGVLREAYRTPEGKIAYRCPSEPVDVFISKGGAIEETEGRKCLCNCLLADIDMPQVAKDGSIEPGLVTSGDGLDDILPYLEGDKKSYSATEVVARLLSCVKSEAAQSPSVDVPVAAAEPAVVALHD
jgi:nitronate monooxygenase